MTHTFTVTVHLSNDFRETCCFSTDLSRFQQAASDGIYDGLGFTFEAEAADHRAAAEVAFAVCNSYPSTWVADYAVEGGGYYDISTEELNGQAIGYRDAVRAYRAAGNRSLSVGDIVTVTRKNTWTALDSDTTDGRYACLSVGFKRF